jgi:PAS domain S-box-containing protein
MAHRGPSSSTAMPAALRYGIAVLSVAIAIGLGFLLLQHFEDKLTPFLFAVAVTVWYVGTGPGVLAIVLSVLSLNYFFLRPFFSFSPISYADLVYLTFCIFCALAVGWVSAVRRRVEQELRQTREQLEAKVVERTANLARSEGYLAETQKLTHTGSWAWDARSRKVLYCSEEMFRIYGLDPRQDLPTRKNFRQRVHPEDRARTDARFARVVHEKVDSFDEYRVLLPDGTVKYVISSGHPVLNGNGELIEVVGTATDVTERKCAEQALRESEAKIRRLVDSNIIGIFVWDFDGRILEANDEFLRMASYDREDLVSGRLRWADLTPPDWRERNNARIEQQKSSGRFEPFEKEFTRKDGSRVPILIGGATFEEGGSQGVAFVLDLTERKCAEQALREREAQLAEARRELRQMIDTIPIPVASYSADARRDFVNAAWKQYTGLSDEAARGTEWSIVAHPDDTAGGDKMWRDALATGEPWHTEERVRRADGQYRWFAIDRVAARDENGKIVKWYGTAYDIEDRKRAEDALRESEYKHRQIIDTVPSHLWSADPYFEPTYLNRHLLDYFGMRSEGFKDGGWQAFLHPDDLAETAKAISHAVQTGTYFEVVHRLRRADGEFRWHHARGKPLRDRQGNIVQWYGLSVDVDEAKKADKRLRRSEAYLAEAQRLGHSGVAAYNETTILYGSDEVFRIWGFDLAQGVPSREAVFQRIHPDDRGRLNAEVKRAVGEKRGYAIGYRLVMPDGTVKHLEAIGQPVFSQSGELVEIVTTQIDVTERKRAEQALRESEARLAEARRELQATVDKIPALVASLWPNGERDFVNLTWQRFTGISQEEARGTTQMIPVHPDHRGFDASHWQRCLETGEPFEEEQQLLRVDGQYRWHWVRREPARDENGKVIKWYGIGFDIEDRKRAEDALRESETKFRDYAETASDWFWEIGPDYKFTLLTENAFGSGAADRIGTACWDHALDLETEPEKWWIFRTTLDARQSFRDFVYCTVDGGGSPIYVKISGKPAFDANREFRGYRGTGSDVTALRTAEAEARENERRYREAQLELAHANRVATMGQVTSSIAHEVNQPITAAVTYALAARRWLNAEPPNFHEVDEALALIVKEGNRAGEVVGRIRALIRKAPARTDAIGINDAVLEVVALTRTEATNNSVAVRTQLAEGLPPVRGDRVQLQQVLLNLIINAIEAMRDVGEKERELLISTRHQPDGVSVEVRDSGPGFTTAVLERVFEAFYTTKADGLGLGLSICRSIIEAHDGRLWARPSVPRGAVFEFTVPAHPDSAS